jgi:hypothetical protein
MRDEVTSRVIPHVESDILFGSKKHPAHEVLVDEEGQWQDVLL